MADSNLCVLCEKKFTLRKNLYAHYRGVHKVLPPTKTSITCPKDDCRFSCNFLADLRMHVEKRHKTEIVKQVMVFKSMKDFQDWKSKEEKKTKSSFVQHCGARRTKAGTERITFVCHRSGKFISASTGKRLLKSQGSIKLGSHCTATIELHREESGICTVAYYSTHFGHDQHIGLLQLSKSDRKLIADKITMGMSFQQILDDVRSSIHSGEPSRLHLITRRDLHNIKRDLCTRNTQQGSIVRVSGQNEILQENVSQDSVSEVSGQNEILQGNGSQARKLVYKLDILKSHVDSGMLTAETMCETEKVLDRLLSLADSDLRRKVPLCRNNEEFKVLRISDKHNIRQKGIFEEMLNIVIVEGQPDREVRTVHVNSDHTYCQN